MDQKHHKGLRGSGVTSAGMGLSPSRMRSQTTLSTIAPSGRSKAKQPASLPGSSLAPKAGLQSYGLSRQRRGKATQTKSAVGKGTAKSRSIDHERFIAVTYGGRRSPSSGATITDDGDVTAANDKIECKSTIGKSISVSLKMLNKIMDEAYEEGREPALAIRFVDELGHYHDWVARPLEEDIRRSEIVHGEA